MPRAPLTAEGGGLGDALRVTVEGYSRCQFRHGGKHAVMVCEPCIHPFESRDRRRGIRLERVGNEAVQKVYRKTLRAALACQTASFH